MTLDSFQRGAPGEPSPSFATSSIVLVDDEPSVDPGAVILTCANCGATMDERKCRLICRCGYFLSCSDCY